MTFLLYCSCYYCVILIVDQIKYLRGVMVRLCSRVGIKFTLGVQIFISTHSYGSCSEYKLLKHPFCIYQQLQLLINSKAMFLSICILNHQKSALVDVIYTNSWFVLKSGLQLYSCPCTSMFCSTIVTDSVTSIV